MDLDTFLTTLYVLVDDWYKAEMEDVVGHRRGPEPQMSDSEVLTVALAGQWRKGVPWQSERSVVRYMQKHGRHWFPTMLQRSAFNERVRNLWRLFVVLQQRVAAWLSSADDVYQSVDCAPLPACSLAQAARGKTHWLWWSTLGCGGNNGGWFYGDQLGAVVTPGGAVTGWLIAPAHIDDRWVLQALVSGRAGQMVLSGPPHRERTGKWGRLVSPVGQRIGPRIAVGQDTGQPYLADEGFNGARWQAWWRQYGAEVITVPPNNVAQPWTWPAKRWLSRRRQIVETVFARLDEVFGMKRLAAHSSWGQYTRVAAKLAAYNLGLWINQMLGRPLGTLATLLC
jgi:hypothetical protein